jgi:hypothetical protein
MNNDAWRYFEWNWNAQKLDTLIDQMWETSFAPFDGLVISESEGVSPDASVYPLGAGACNDEATMNALKAVVRSVHRAEEFFEVRIAKDLPAPSQLDTLMGVPPLSYECLRCRVINMTEYYDYQLKADRLLARIRDLLKPKYISNDGIFRPAILKEASNQVMKWLKTHPNDIDRMHWRSVEAIIAEILKTKGWDVELTKMTRDGGIDLIAVKSDSLGFDIVMLVEVKKPTSSIVGTPTIDQL